MGAVCERGVQLQTRRDILGKTAKHDGGCVYGWH